ncbi:DNA-directed RNA polymerase subunit beta [Pullulanibacillus sp. KACC 23026]|uniref:DNA-directed RNA polymerase subunit beta n=1 Tax=Pullulanibacillus sp. KACC 23026 TaxID=3028315 RepID=UPI0023AFD40E|nr:DNA-directed RNA polymerase subunit beta [Pullulanibacillus sp. KACC 23026]WEG13135.1 DNA-directed RNA polymerase subunit beta [Pullulanibacillus sp. KACC 23026]
MPTPLDPNDEKPLIDLPDKKQKDQQEEPENQKPLNLDRILTEEEALAKEKPTQGTPDAMPEESDPVQESNGQVSEKRGNSPVQAERATSLVQVSDLPGEEESEDQMAESVPETVDSPAQETMQAAVGAPSLTPSDPSSEPVGQTSPSSAPVQSRETLRKQRLKEEQAPEGSKKQKEKEEEKSRAAKCKKEEQETKRLKVRLFPIWLRLVIILVLCIVATIGGSMVGYGFIGKGNPMDVFNLHTWTHIRDIIYAKK